VKLPMETRLRILAKVYGIPWDGEMSFELFCMLARAGR
jgi:hypothetical protein